MLRGLSLALLLLSAPVHVASAMDQSATEETNCLMACDANQEHCASSPHAMMPKNYSVAARLPAPNVKPLAGLHRAVKGR